MKKVQQPGNHRTPRRAFLAQSTCAATGAVIAGTIQTAPVHAMEENMSIFEVFRTRRSVRNFTSDPVPDEHINRIVDAARLAPTSGNQQPWKFLVVRDRKKIDELKDACITRRIGRAPSDTPSEELNALKEQVTDNYNRYLSAPVYIIVLTDSESRYPGYNHHDGPLAAANLLLAARALGYGSVYITDSIPDEVTRKVFNIPERFLRVCITPIGVPVDWPETPPKKDLNEFIQYDQFS